MDCSEDQSESEQMYYYCPEKKCVVVMQKLENTITNQQRKYIVDKKNAAYRANMLQIVAFLQISDSPIPISVKIPYRTGQRTHIWNTYRLGDIVGDPTYPFNKYTMYYGIPFFSTRERAEYEHACCSGKNIVQLNQDKYTLTTYDSFGKQTRRTYCVEDGTELYSVGELLEPLGILVTKILTSRRHP